MHCTRLFQHALLLAPFALPLTAHASPSSDALRTLAQDDWVTRSVSLAELGITNPVVLDQSDNHQAFFLPVPKGVALSEAVIEVRGDFIRGEAIAPTLKMAVDGRPLLAQRVSDEAGKISRTLPVEARGHANGFVHFSLDWSSPNGQQRLCEPNRQTANIFTLLPSTQLTYRYPLAALTQLSDAWNTLPGKPVILIAAGKLDSSSFDSAWRLGVALERAGKRTQVRALPAVGDAIKRSGFSVPTGLNSVPAFAALAGEGSYTLSNAAELGALLVLDAPATRADLAIADSALTGQINSALDALAEQLRGDPEALKAFADWRSRHASLAGKPLLSQQVQLASLGHRAVIALAGDAGAKASGLFDTQWRNVLTSRQAIVHASGGALSNKDHLRLSTLGGSHTTFDVVTRGEWTATFPLSAVSVNGRMPGEVVFDLSAAPGASATRPVASVIWNGVLLNAKQLDANGQAERLSARVPGYALGVSNTLQVRFQRQPVSPDCAEIPQGYPVNVLPSSYLQAASAEPDGTFVGLLPLLAGNAQVIVANAALEQPAANLRQIIRLATAASISPVNAELTLTDGTQTYKPSKPFLALQVPLQGAKPLIDVEAAERLRAHGDDKIAVDVQGPQGLSAISVVESAGQQGVLWYALGEQPVVPQDAFVLTRGNAVVLGAAGPLTWVDTTDPELNLGATPFHQWRTYLVWALPVFAAVLLLLLVLGVLARRSRLKHKGK